MDRPLNKSGVKTTELWVMAGGLLGIVATHLGLVDFPAASLILVVQWALGRGLEKFLAPVGSEGKRAWQTSEFWLSVGAGGLFAAFPDAPTESIALVTAYLATRIGIKKKHLKTA